MTGRVNPDALRLEKRIEAFESTRVGEELGEPSEGDLLPHLLSESSSGPGTTAAGSILIKRDAGTHDKVGH